MTTIRTEPRTRPTFARLSLFDLIMTVSAAGLALGLARRARGVWMGFPGTLDRAVGTSTMVLAVMLCVPIARQALAACRSGGGVRAWAWPIAWRAAIVAVLSTAALQQDWLLRLDPSGEWFSPMTFPPRNRQPIEARFGLLPIMAAIGLIGTLAGLTPVRERTPSTRPGLPIHWLMVPLVAVVGLLMAVAASEIPSLVLIAIDGVTTALRSTSGRGLPDVMMRGTPSLARRMDRAGFEALIVLALCVATGIVLSRDLRRDLSAQRATWIAMAPRLLLLLVTALAGLRLIFVTVPRLHPSLLEGMEWMLEPIDVVMILGGFGLLGAGLAARAVAPNLPASTEAQRLLRALRFAVVLSVLAAALLTSLSQAVLFAAKSFTGDFVGMMTTAEDAVRDRFPLLATIAPYLSPQPVAWAMSLTWLAVMVAGASLTKPGSQVAPMDGIGGTWSRLAWFLWCAAGLAVLCVVAVPALALGGIMLENLHCRGWALSG